MHLAWFQLVFVGLAAMAAGFVNALAGGGTLISFPALTAIGLPAVAANVTNTVALVPGYLGATLAQMKELRTMQPRVSLHFPAGVMRGRTITIPLMLALYLPAAVVGGVIGGILLLNSGEKLFRSLVPFLILLASILLAVSDPLRAWVMGRAGKRGATIAAVATWGVLPVGLAAIYGGYFGAGLSVIVLAVLGLVLSDSLTQLNALKQAIAFCVNLAAAIFFVFSGKVVWPVALVMAVCALLGGALGGRLAGRIKPSILRRLVVAIGLAVAAIYFVRG
jgi:uncharacterized protein